MAKISIVRRRLERRKNLETSALTRARKLDTSREDSDDFFDLTLSEPELEQKPKSAVPDYSEKINGLFDLELTESQTTELKRLFPIQYSEDGNHLNNNAGLEIFKNADNKVVFRFNIRPSHPFQTLTSEDVCEMLKISRSTLYKTVHEKNLPSFKIGSQLRFLLEDVIKYLEKCKSNTNLVH